METFKKFRTIGIIFSSISIALGGFMVLLPGVSMLTICYLLGVLFFAGGICELYRYFRLGPMGLLFRFDLALGIFGIAVGLMLILHPAGVMIILPLAIGFYLLIDNVFVIQSSVEMKRMELHKWWLVLILGILSAVFALLLIFNPLEGAKTLMIIMGIALIVNGTQNLYTIINLSKSIDIKHD